jgi:hypothetical protein
MISCTEFIPSYSELFTYLEDKHGREEVTRFWKYLFEPTGDGIPLINYVKREGIRGCFSYWAGTLNEEAADFTMYLNEKAGWFMNIMHQCPSKGRLLKLKDEIGITPYHDYCLHCDSYRSAVEKIGLKYIYNFQGIDHAACSMLIYDPEVFDGRVIIDEAGIEYNNRAFKEFSDKSLYFFKYHRHYRLAIDLFSQGLDCDKKIRDLAQRLYVVKKSLIPFFVYRRRIAKKVGINELTKEIIDEYYFVPLSRKYIFSPPLWHMFNTLSRKRFPTKVWQKW